MDTQVRTRFHHLLKLLSSASSTTTPIIISHFKPTVLYLHTYSFYGTTVLALIHTHTTPCHGHVITESDSPPENVRSHRSFVQQQQFPILSCLSICSVQEQKCLQANKMWKRIKLSCEDKHLKIDKRILQNLEGRQNFCINPRQF